MADTSLRTGAGTTERTRTPATGPAGEEPSGWVGWNAFAATMMIVVGSLHAVWGLVAILNDEWVVWANEGSLYLDLTEWGWIHLVAGGVVFLAGLGIFVGNVLARAVGVVVAGVSFVANFLTLPAYPVWSIAMMVLTVLVIWALTAHGHEMRTMSSGFRRS